MVKLNNKTRKKLIITAIFLVAIISSGAIVLNSYAVGLPFGGFITSSVLCTCSGTWLLTVGPPVGGFFVYANTPQFPYAQLPRPGVWVLGLYEPGGVCLMWYGPTCGPASAPVIGTITPIVGTSL